MIQSSNLLFWSVLTVCVCSVSGYLQISNKGLFLRKHVHAPLHCLFKNSNSLISATRKKSMSVTMTIAEKEIVAKKDALLPRERYVVFNRFQARDGAGPRFEKRWADRKSSLAKIEGFRFFTLLRRADDLQSTDGKLVSYPDGTPNYMSMTVWETKENFSAWRTSYAFKEAHGGGSIGGFLSALVSR